MIHLKSCFITSSTIISSNFGIATQQIDEIHQQNYTNQHLGLWSEYINCFTQTQVEQAIHQLDDKKDPGPMQITSQFMKFNSQIISPLLTKIFNCILRTSVIPSDWKTSFITPIPKRGAINNISNYRGIAMQSVIPKFVDKILTATLQQDLASIIPHQQHGFVPYKGTTTNWLEFIQKQLKMKKQMDVIYFDYSKAFDQVDHKILLSKLAKFSIPLPLLQVVGKFITGRSYKLKIDDVVSATKFTTESSVPQGSHIGPLLYTIMCHDLPQCALQSDTLSLLYADDTKFAQSIGDSQDQIKLQQSIDRLTKWSRENRLMLNLDKCKYVCFGRLKNNINERQYFIGTTSIQKIEQHVDLGVLFDDQLTSIPHIEVLTTKMRSLYGVAFRFAKEIGNMFLLKKITRTYIMPVLEYSSVIWDQHRIGYNNTLERVLHQMSRAALHLPFDVRHERYIDQRCTD